MSTHAPKPMKDKLLNIQEEDTNGKMMIAYVVGTF